MASDCCIMKLINYKISSGRQNVMYSILAHVRFNDMYVRTYLLISSKLFFVLPAVVSLQLAWTLDRINSIGCE